MDIQYIFDKIKPNFYRHKDEDHAEIEIRLGRFNGSMFDTNVGKETFHKLMRRLQKYDGWEQVVNTSQEVFYRESDNTRISIDENTGDETVVRKERVLNEDFKNIKGAPFYFRVSISKEIPVDDDFSGDMDKKKSKSRLSFVRKNLSIDMTTCTGDAHDMDAEDPVVYQVEMEIVDPKKVNDERELYNILNKIGDVFKILV